MGSRKAVAGRCPSCGIRTLRGPDQHGTYVVVTVAEVSPAQELALWTRHVPTYRASWSAGIRLDRRSDHDLASSPPGYAPGRIYPTHTCQEAP